MIHCNTYIFRKLLLIFYILAFFVLKIHQCLKFGLISDILRPVCSNHIKFIQKLNAKFVNPVDFLCANFITRSFPRRRSFVGNKAKERISNGSFKKTKHVKFFEKLTFLIAWYAHVSGGKKFALEIRPFALLPTS